MNAVQQSSRKNKQGLIIEHNSNIECSIYKSLLFSNIRNEVLTDIIIHPEHFRGHFSYLSFRAVKKITFQKTVRGFYCRRLK
jgi:hypothetical protein